MQDFIPFEKEPEPQPAGSRFGPPGKRTGIALLDPSQFPFIHPRCFGCSRRLALADVGQHVLNCEKISAGDLARFKAALGDFQTNPALAREVAQAFIDRFRANGRLDPLEDVLGPAE